MSKISIITTTYNHKDFIKDTIESIINQSFSDRELLIWDDSPDNKTWDIIQSYVKKYPNKIKAWHHQPNKWIVDNINFLLKMVDKKSEYISFLEWDDMFVSDNLEKKLKIFYQYKNIALVYSDLSFIDKNNHIILKSFFDRRNIPFFQNEIISIQKFILQPAWPIASWSTCMIKKTVLEKYNVISLEPSNKKYSVSDYDLYFRVSSENKVFGIKESLTLYRRHQWNLSWSNWWTSDDLEKLIDYYYKQKIINISLYGKKKSWTNIVSVIFALEAWNKKSALKKYIKSFKYWFLSYPLFKIAILWFFILPTVINRKILNFFIKRG